MACEGGFHCGKSHFWRLMRNPIYCGIIKVPANKLEEEEFVMANHEPLISEGLFNQVQLIITKDRNKRGNKDALKALFPLRGLIFCPLCGGKITGSVSQGKRLKYPYYHCMGYKCQGRFKAEVLNSCYEDKLKEIHVRPEVYELFELVLEDENIFTCRREYLGERKKILETMSRHELYLSKARKYLLDDKIDSDDFNKLKKEQTQILGQLNHRLNSIDESIAKCDRSDSRWPDTKLCVFQSYRELDIKGRCDIISLITPTSINPATKGFDALEINEVISLIVEHKK